MKKVARKKLRPAELRKTYVLAQCPLYKMRSKARLASVLFTTPSRAVSLSQKKDNYKIFTIPATADPFSTPRKERPAQVPKEDLRRLHARLLQLLQRIEAPSYLQSALKGRSYKTNAGAHVSSERLIKLDIRRFFPSTTESRAFVFFVDTMHCAPDIARILAKLCTCDGVLPTGSPLSPLFSYYANKHMFDELAELARQRDLIFTCYIDDLAFSGSNLSRGFADEVGVIVRKNGFSIAQEKTHYYRRGVIKLLTGVVIAGGQLTVPNQRFKKVRALQRAIAAEEDSVQRLRLLERLNGLLGEAAHLNPRFQGWSNSIKQDLRKLRQQARGLAP